MATNPLAKYNEQLAKFRTEEAKIAVLMKECMQQYAENQKTMGHNTAFKIYNPQIIYLTNWHQALLDAHNDKKLEHLLLGTSIFEAVAVNDADAS